MGWGEGPSSKEGETAEVGAVMDLWGCDAAPVQCPCTHLPFLFHQNRSPLTSYPSIVIKMPFSVSDRSYADVVSLSAWSPHARPESHIIEVDDEVKAA